MQTKTHLSVFTDAALRLSSRQQQGQFAEASTHDYSSALGSRQNIQMTPLIFSKPLQHTDLSSLIGAFECVGE